MMRALSYTSVLAGVLVAAAALGCKREQRRFSETSFLSGTPSPAPGPAPYVGNAWAMSEGSQLYRWFNCVGCHSHGGGGMGPALMDSEWRYGSEPPDVYRSIVEGRPNGMPTFKDRITEDQAWKLVAYVRSLSGLQPKDAAPGRNDELQNRTNPSRMKTPVPKPEKTP